MMTDEAKCKISFTPDPGENPFDQAYKQLTGKASDDTSDELLRLTTHDRWTGAMQSLLLTYRTYRDGIVLVASNETEHYKPHWYLNLKEEPIVEFEVGGKRRFAIASTPVGKERLEIWPLVEEITFELTKSVPRRVTGVLLSPMEG